MFRKTAIALTLGTTLLLPAQTSAQNAPRAASATGQTMWSASKLIGVAIYNDQKEKVGEINEVLLDRGGALAGVIVAAGSFLGTGSHDVLVRYNQLKFSDEPLSGAAAERGTRTTSAPQSSANNTDRVPNVTPTVSAADNARSTRNLNEKWYPDHAILSMTKEQVKAMPAFSYDGTPNSASSR